MHIATFAVFCWMILAPMGVVSAIADELPPGAAVVSINSQEAPPDWALMQRYLLMENERAARLYFSKYWDERGFFPCIERWSWIDGADDVLQGLANFPLLYALGAGRDVLDMYYLAFEGYLEQFTTREVQYAPKFGVLHNEFLTADDWHHHAEHLAAFNQLPLADPANETFRKRALRFGGFYLNEGLPDRAEPIYDKKLKLIRSIVNGSLGAQIEIEPTFWGREWQQWADRTMVKGDGPLNLYATTMPANAFLLSGHEKYREWVLEYVRAWAGRAAENNGIFPANVGLSGKIGEHWGGRWWPQSLGAWSVKGKAGADGLGLFISAIVSGMENALILSGDRSFMEPLRRQVHVLLQNAIKHDDGKLYPPGLYEDDGWAGRFRFGRHLVSLYLTDFRDDDLRLIEEEIERWGRPGQFSYGTEFYYHVDDFAWLYFVLGRNNEFPGQMMASDVARIRSRLRDIRGDATPPEKRETHHTHRYNPLATHALFNMIAGGVGPLHAKGTSLVRTELWPFDPVAARPGLPPDVAVMVDRITENGVRVHIVNLHQGEPRTIVLRMGAYGEHQCLRVRHGNQTTDVNRSFLAVRLEPGCGDTLLLDLKRYANKPAAGIPWAQPQETGK
ncbi:MAG TPA: hypothetical protein VM141_09520 [Planctomycetota bacterium]|nr:hypothetical protein [Planctomycetota bacterium]